jgi:hypothetical protein
MSQQLSRRSLKCRKIKTISEIAPKWIDKIVPFQGKCQLFVNLGFAKSLSLGSLALGTDLHLSGRERARLSRNKPQRNSRRYGNAVSERKRGSPASSVRQCDQPVPEHSCSGGRSNFGKCGEEPGDDSVACAGRQFDDPVDVGPLLRFFCRADVVIACGRGCAEATRDTGDGASANRRLGDPVDREQSDISNSQPIPCADCGPTGCHRRKEAVPKRIRYAGFSRDGRAGADAHNIRRTYATAIFSRWERPECSGYECPAITGAWAIDGIASQGRDRIYCRIDADERNDCAGRDGRRIAPRC